jgi:hypothetical protein
MRLDDSSSSDLPWIVALCVFCVAITSPCNIIVMVFSWGILQCAFGGPLADNSSGALIVINMGIHTGMFGLILSATCYFSRTTRQACRYVAVIAITAIYIGFWFSWTLWALVEMAHTNNWL